MTVEGNYIRYISAQSAVHQDPIPHLRVATAARRAGIEPGVETAQPIKDGTPKGHARASADRPGLECSVGKTVLGVPEIDRGKAAPKTPVELEQALGRGFQLERQHQPG